MAAPAGSVGHQPDVPFGCTVTWGPAVLLADMGVHVCNEPDSHTGRHVCKCGDTHARLLDRKDGF